MEFDEVQRVKQERSFATGSIRGDRSGKGRYDLLSPIALRRLAKHCENGARVYSARNWEKGQPLSCMFDSAVRHLYTFLYDQMLGNEPEEDHLAAAMWNVQGVIHTQEMIRMEKLPKELDDLNNYFERLQEGEFDEQG